jgi:ribosomal protein S18 acetylase RimI-like enzyme
MASEGQDPRKAGTIWVLDLAEPVEMVPPGLPARFGPVGADALTELAQAMNADPVEVGLRFETGRRCYAARVAGALAAYGWVSFHEELVGELRLRVRLLPGEAYIWDCATLPEYRQKHLFSALLGFMLAELRAAGYRRAWIGANLENTISQRGMERAGFQHIADLVLNRVVGPRLAWVQGLPGVPEELVSEARRVFLDNRDQVWLNATLIRR